VLLIPGNLKNKIKIKENKKKLKRRNEDKLLYLIQILMNLRSGFTIQRLDIIQIVKKL